MRVCRVCFRPGSCLSRGPLALGIVLYKYLTYEYRLNELQIGCMQGQRPRGAGMWTRAAPSEPAGAAPGRSVRAGIEDGGEVGVEGGVGFWCIIRALGV